MKSFLESRFREGALIGVSAVCLYLLLALASYSPSDPGWSATGDASGIRNAGGPAGALLADVFFSVVGCLAYLLPALLAQQAWALFRQRRAHLVCDWLGLAVRALGLVLVLIAGTALVTMSGASSGALPQGLGGILGQAVSDAFTGAFSVTGSRLILLAVLLFGMSILTGMSWLRLMERVGCWTLSGLGGIRGALERLRHRSRDGRRRLRARQERRILIDEHVARERQRKPPTFQSPPARAEPGARVEREKQRPLFDTPLEGELPNLDLLDAPVREPGRGYSQEALEGLSKRLELKLADFGISAEVVAVYPGPVITRLEIQPAPGVKASRISSLAKDLARSLAVVSVRVVEVIPGKSVVGVEIPNQHREIVNFREVLSSRVFDAARPPLTLALGHDISGQPVVADLAKMPHLLVAGTTGAGKSVGINAMLLSLLYKSGPGAVRLILVDPKMLELSVYEGIPHLLAPVITDMKDAANGLRWCVAEMERRYKLMAALGVRNLAGYNRKLREAAAMREPIADPLWAPDSASGEADGGQPAPPALDTLPCIVVVIDEFADMMMIVGKKVEQLIARIAQKARAAGIHMILATQRPSVDVITGLIKANIPTRIAFQVSSKVDSRTILDQGGAEQLLGHGDMLYLPPGTAVPIRVHGAFVDDHEVHRVVADWKRRGQPAYLECLFERGADAGALGEAGAADEDAEEADSLYDQAVHHVAKSRRASISSVQRKLRIGYNRAARLVEAMEAAGVVSAVGHNGQREVLAPPADG